MEELNRIETVHNIADWFLSRESMTHKKLQKLCYYSQAWYCTLYDGNPLFHESIEAWVHGPVIPELYRRFSDYRWMNIESKKDFTIQFHPMIIDVLEAVYLTYKDLTGDQLEILTHSEEPWINARRGLPAWESCNNIISCDMMRKYYAKKYEESQSD